MNNTIASLVQSQFPEFVREDYPALIKFIELYYQYLELEKNPQDMLSNLIAYNDIDRTLDEFISKFEKTYLNGLPQDVAGDKRQFLKHVNDLYQTKGTEESFRMLFRLMFNEEIELYYPKQQMLRTSSGRWEQRNSIKVRLANGSGTDVLNKKIKIHTSSGTINTHVKNAVEDEGGIWELYIDKQFSIPVSPGDRVTGLDFEAYCQPNTVSCEVMTPGAGFHVGQVFEIQSARGTGTKVKVTRVDANGGIRRLAFIEFGNGYASDFLVSLTPNDRISGSVDPYQSYTNGFVESVLVTKVTYFSSNYVDVTYSGDVVGSSYNNDYRPDNALDDNMVPAAVKFNIGALCAYRGEYTTADGFLSDVNVIQDGYMYQDFSYVIKSKQKLVDYANIVKKLVHPAGTILFGEMQGETELDLGNFFDYQKVLSAAMKFVETVNTVETAPTFSVGKKANDTVTPSETTSKTTTKPLTDSTTPAETSTRTTGKNLTDSTTPAEAATYSTIKALTEALTPAETSRVMAIAKALTEAATPSEAITLNSTKAFTEIQVIAETISAIRTDYAESTYLAGDYVGVVLF